jgi:predicted ATPase
MSAIRAHGERGATQDTLFRSHEQREPVAVSAESVILKALKMGDQTRSSTKSLFVLTGPPGSGKTPIVRELMALGFTGVAEPAREVIAEQRAIGGDSVYDTNPRLFLNLMLSRAVADLRRMTGAPGPVFFDRGIPDLIGYAELFGLDASDAAIVADVHRYSDLVFVLPSWPEIYVTDSERRMTFEAAKAFGERVRSIYVELGYSVVDVPCDTVVARAQFILDTSSLNGERHHGAAGQYYGFSGDRPPGSSARSQTRG